MSLDLTSNDSQINFKMREVKGQKIFEFDDFRLDALHLLLFRGQEQLNLTPKVVETLLAFVERSGEVLSKDELMDIVWPDSIVEESNLSQNLYLLRKTLGNTENGVPFIETLRRRGYRFNGEVNLSNGTPAAAETNNGSSYSSVDKIEPAAEIIPQTSPLRTLNVERHGNVLALADWKKDESVMTPPSQTEPALLKPDEGANPRRLAFYLAMVASVAILGSFLVLGLPSLSSGTSEYSKGDVSVTKLTDGDSLDAAAISLDGNYFTYVTNDGKKNHLWLQQTGHTNKVEITEPFEGYVYGTSFTPDSKFIYFVVNEKNSDRNTLFRVPVLGGIRTKVLFDVEAPVSFSPDGTEMAFMRGSKEANASYLMTAASDGTSERILLMTKGEENRSLNGGGAWSPDGKTVAFGLVDTKTIARGPCTLIGIDVTNGETRELSPEKWDNCFRIAWTRDSQGLVFIGTRINDGLTTRRDQVYYVNINDGRSRRITSDGSRYQYASLGVTNKDEIFAVPFNRLSQIWAMSADGDARTVVQITNGQSDGRAGLTPLVDGRVGYITRNGDTLSVWTVNSDGSNRKQLTTDPPQIEELRAPPDGSFFIFSAKRDGQDHLYRVESDGSDLRQLTFGDGFEDDSTISPDGRVIVYHSLVFNGDLGNTSLWRIPSSGGEPILLSDIDCKTPHFSPDGGRISCVSSDWKKIFILSADTGEVIKTFASHENPILNVGVHWTPDSKALAYIVTQNNTGNLFIQPVDGGEPQKLTNFTGGEIYNFSYSPDGTRLFLARGYAVRNAVLIQNFR